MSEKDDLEQVIAQIEAAFEDTPYPGDEHIGWGCGWEGGLIQEAFRGKHWRDISLELMLEHRWKIHCTTPEGFRFYLPAWMLAVFTEYAKLSETVVFSLAPPIRTEHTEHFLRRANKFTHQEKMAILSFLWMLLELYPENDDWSLFNAIEFWEDQLEGHNG